MKTLELGQIIDVLGIDSRVAFQEQDRQYYLEAIKSSNSIVFTILGINGHQLQQQTLGYQDQEGIFPQCKTLEDQTKFVEAIINYNKPKETMKKVYKLKDSKYLKPTLNIIGISEEYWQESSKSFLKDSPAHTDILNAGVMHWFEEVQQETIVDMGSFKLTIKDKKVYHNYENTKEDITDFVIGLHRMYSSMLGSFNHLGKNGYKAVVANLLFSSTGCENNQTQLSDWMKVYELIK